MFGATFNRLNVFFFDTSPKEPRQLLTMLASLYKSEFVAVRWYWMAAIERLSTLVWFDETKKCPRLAAPGDSIEIIIVKNII